MAGGSRSLSWLAQVKADSAQAGTQLVRVSEQVVEERTSEVVRQGLRGKAEPA